MIWALLYILISKKQLQLVMAMNSEDGALFPTHSGLGAFMGMSGLLQIEGMCTRERKNTI